MKEEDRKEIENMIEKCVDKKLIIYWWALAYTASSVISTKEISAMNFMIGAVLLFLVFNIGHAISDLIDKENITPAWLDSFIKSDLTQCIFSMVYWSAFISVFWLIFG